MCLRLPLTKQNLTQVLLVGHQLAGDAQGSPLLSPVWILAGVGLGCKRQVPTLPVFSLCISHGCFPRYMVSQHWGHEGCTERGIPLCRFFISLAIADTWISPGKSRARAELGRRRWWNKLVHLSFDSAKEERLFYSAATVWYPIEKGQFWEAFCREAFKKEAKVKGEAEPGVRDQGWELPSLESWGWKPE